MFDIEKYIASGILENYCLGLAAPEEAAELERHCMQYPAIKKELIFLQKKLIGYTGQYSKIPPINAGHKILNGIEELKLNQEMLSGDKKRIKEFIAISEFSNIEKWEQLIGHLTPGKEYKNVHFHEIYNNGKKQQAVMWLKKGAHDESHDDLREKFLIMEGTCTCKVGDKYVHMMPGSFLDIPLYTVHNLRVTSIKPVKLVITKEKLRKAV